MKRKLALAQRDAAVVRRVTRWQRKFLCALAKVPSVKHACQVAGVNRTLVYKVRKSDLEFAEQWQAAIDASVDDVEAKAFRFTLEDTDPATANARVRLWEFILRSHRPGDLPGAARDRRPWRFHLRADAKRTKSRERRD